MIQMQNSMQRPYKGIHIRRWYGFVITHIIFLAFSTDPPILWPCYPTVLEARSGFATILSASALAICRI